MQSARSSEGIGQGLTTRLAEFAANYRFEALPPAVVERAREIVLDTIGSILLRVGPEYSSVRRLVELAGEFGGPPQCTLIGQSTKSDLLSAALVNGTAGYAADIEGAGVARQHASAVLVPTTCTDVEHVTAGLGRDFRILAPGATSSTRAAQISLPP